MRVIVILTGLFLQEAIYNGSEQINTNNKKRARNLRAPSISNLRANCPLGSTLNHNALLSSCHSCFSERKPKFAFPDVLRRTSGILLPRRFFGWSDRPRTVRYI